MGGKFSRDKGLRYERWLVNKFQEAGFGAERVPLSGASHGKFGGDISLPLLGRDRRVEVKSRASGFAQLYDWLDGSDFLIVKRDRGASLVVVPLDLAIEIARAAERNK